jgi:hypothetical protein
MGSNVAADQVRTTRYSSRVELELIVEGHSIKLDEIGDTSVTLSAPASVRRGLAEVVIHVDGQPERWTVEILPHDRDSLDIPIRMVS